VVKVTRLLCSDQTITLEYSVLPVTVVNGEWHATSGHGQKRI